MAQQLRVHPTMQRTLVKSLLWTDPTCDRTTIPVQHKHWVHAPESLRSTKHHNERVARHPEQQTLLSATRENPCTATKTQGSQKQLNKKNYLLVKVSVTQLHPALLCDPMDCTSPGSSVHGILQTRNTRGGCHFLLQGIFPMLGLNPGLLHCI